MLTANDRGDPSMELSAMLAPGLRVTKVLSHDLATCKQQPVVPATPVAPATPPAPVSPPTNFPPILRNPIDTINATLGELLVYKVQDVSKRVFYFLKTGNFLENFREVSV